MSEPQPETPRKSPRKPRRRQSTGGLGVKRNSLRDSQKAIPGAGKVTKVTDDAILSAFCDEQVWATLPRLSPTPTSSARKPKVRKESLFNHRSYTVPPDVGISIWDLVNSPRPVETDRNYARHIPVSKPPLFDEIDLDDLKPKERNEQTTTASLSSSMSALPSPYGTSIWDSIRQDDDSGNHLYSQSVSEGLYAIAEKSPKKKKKKKADPKKHDSLTSASSSGSKKKPKKLRKSLSLSPNPTTKTPKKKLKKSLSLTPKTRTKKLTSSLDGDSTSHHSSSKDSMSRSSSSKMSSDSKKKHKKMKSLSNSSRSTTTSNSSYDSKMKMVEMDHGEDLVEMGHEDLVSAAVLARKLERPPIWKNNDEPEEFALDENFVNLIPPLQLDMAATPLVATNIDAYTFEPEQEEIWHSVTEALVREQLVRIVERSGMDQLLMPPRRARSLSPETSLTQRNNRIRWGDDVIHVIEGRPVRRQSAPESYYVHGKDEVYPTRNWKHQQRGGDSPLAPPRRVRSVSPPQSRSQNRDWATSFPTDRLLRLPQRDTSDHRPVDETAARADVEVARLRAERDKKKRVDIEAQEQASAAAADAERVAAKEEEEKAKLLAAKEEETKRLALEAQRIAEDAERIAAEEEAEAKKRAEEETARQQATEAAEAQRMAKEEARKRKAAEERAKREEERRRVNEEYEMGAMKGRRKVVKKDMRAGSGWSKVV